MAGPLNDQEKAELKFEKLGFQTTLHCNVAGTVAGGLDRQRVLEMASPFVQAAKSLTCFNDGIRLGREQGNQYDSFAVQVWLAQSRVGAAFGSHALAGYIPRRVCTRCEHSWGGKDVMSHVCPECDENLIHQPMSYLNKFILEHYINQGRGIWFGVEWINKADPTSHWGCRLALGFPPIEMRPPNA